jgi:two-component sensor histidine kinase
MRLAAIVVLFLSASTALSAPEECAVGWYWNGVKCQLNHREKNTLASVQSIARLSISSAGDVGEYATALESRLISLSSAYNLLTANNWQGADLKDIVAQTVAPYESGSRIKIDGGSVLLSPKLTLALTAAIEELVTNAAKYGALSTNSGRVAISWREGFNGSIILMWIESGGPEVKEPKRQGFGTRLIKDALSNEVGWSVDLEFLRAGLQCKIEFLREGETRALAQ